MKNPRLPPCKKAWLQSGQNKPNKQLSSKTTLSANKKKFQIVVYNREFFLWKFDHYLRLSKVRHQSKGLTLFPALNWLGGKSVDDRTEATLIECAEYPTSSGTNLASVTTTAAVTGTPETGNQASVVITSYQPMRKYSTYMKNNTKIPKGAR